MKRILPLSFIILLFQTFSFADIVLNNSVWQNTTIVVTPPDPCSGSPSVGTVCSDGTVYAGLSTDGNVPMYTTRCDYGQTYSGGSCTGTAASVYWYNGTGPFIDEGMTNLDTGQANTAYLAALSDADSPHPTAVDCNALSTSGITHGSGNWYQPALNELNVLYTNRVAIGHFDTSGTLYWASNDQGANLAKIEDFSSGSEGFNGKNHDNNFRCVRR